MEELKENVASMAMNMDKLRHELNYIRSTLSNGRKANTTNGIRRLRTELQV